MHGELTSILTFNTNSKFYEEDYIYVGEYISQVTGYSYKDVISSLKGAIYQNPEKWEECFYKGWETSDEYLSGNVLRKLRIAKELNGRFKGYFNQNIKANEPYIHKSNVIMIPATIFFLYLYPLDFRTNPKLLCNVLFITLI